MINDDLISLSLRYDKWCRISLLDLEKYMLSSTESRYAINSYFTSTDIYLYLFISYFFSDVLPIPYDTCGILRNDLLEFSDCILNEATLDLIYSENSSDFDKFINDHRVLFDTHISFFWYYFNSTIIKLHTDHAAFIVECDKNEPWLNLFFI